MLTFFEPVSASRCLLTSLPFSGRSHSTCDTRRVGLDLNDVALDIGEGPGSSSWRPATLYISPVGTYSLLPVLASKTSRASWSGSAKGWNGVALCGSAPLAILSLFDLLF